MRSLLPVAFVSILVAACETGDPPQGVLVAAYPMDDLVAGMVTDASGNAHHGACTSCPGVVAGKTISGFDFNGGDQQIDIPPDAAFSNRALSVTAWVKLDTAPPQIPGCAAVKGNAWQMCITPQLAPTFGSLTGSGALTLGTFHHVAISFDGKTKRIFLDGDEVLAQDAPVADDPAGISLGPELIGVIDDVRIFAGAITAEQLAEVIGV